MKENLVWNSYTSSRSEVTGEGKLRQMWDEEKIILYVAIVNLL